MGKTYPTRVDWWIYPALVLPLIGSAIALVSGAISGSTSVLLIGVGSLTLYALVLVALILPVGYALDDGGFHLRAGRMKLHVPYDRLISAELTSNPLSSPALSLRRIRIRYRKPSGKETWVQISPPDREQFLADLVEASKRHKLVDGKVVERA